MKYLEKLWVRVLVSLFVGGMLTEIIHISTGDPNRPQTSNPSLFYAALLFVVITIILRASKKGY